MKEEPNSKNVEVTKFLNDLDHPLINEIEKLREVVLNAVSGLSENIKWNGPNYSFNNEDRITMRINPPRQIQLVFHRGAKKFTQPEDKLIRDESGLLVWKEKDRAIASFKTLKDIENRQSELRRVVKDWIAAT